MIEQIMIFALGFLVSGLLTLMFLPAFWRRALRLSRRRLEMQMPLSMTEIVAERDQLRAEFASERRRIEQRSDALLAGRAQDMSELGRRARLIGELEADLAENKSKVAAQADALEALERRAVEAEGQFATADKELFDLDGRLARVSGTLSALDSAHKELAGLAEERRAAVAAAETLATSLTLRIEGLQREREALSRSLAVEQEKGHRLGDERDFAKASAVSTANKLQTANAAIEDLNAELGKLRNALEDERRAKLGLESKAKIAAQTLADAEERASALRANLDEQSAFSRTSVHDHEAQISALRAEKSTLEGALQAARKELASLRAVEREPAPPLTAVEPARIDEEDAILRRAISDVGTEVSRLVRVLEDHRAGEASAGLGELMRALQARASRTAPSN